MHGSKVALLGHRIRIWPEMTREERYVSKVANVICSRGLSGAGGRGKGGQVVLARHLGASNSPDLHHTPLLKGTPLQCITGSKVTNVAMLKKSNMTIRAKACTGAVSCQVVKRRYM